MSQPTKASNTLAALDEDAFEGLDPLVDLRSSAPQSLITEMLLGEFLETEGSLSGSQFSLTIPKPDDASRFKRPGAPSTQAAKQRRLIALEQKLGTFRPRQELAPSFQMNWQSLQVERTIVSKTSGKQRPLQRAQQGTSGMVSPAQLGAPVVSPNGKMVAVTNFDPASKNNHVSVWSVDALNKNKRDPGAALIASAYYPQHFRTATWISNDLLATGGGHNGIIQLFEVVGGPQGILRRLGDPVKQHKGEIREMAVCPKQRTLIASGSHDTSVMVWDCQSEKKLMQIGLNSPVSSLSWGSQDGIAGKSEICVTTDGGNFGIFDVRMGAMAQLTQRKNSRIKWNQKFLWAHCRYSRNNVLLGWGNATIHHWDLRKCKKDSSPIQSFVDPHIEGCGHIDYNATSEAIVLSGFKDFSVWKHNKAWNETNCWSHSKKNGYAAERGYNMAARFLDEDTVVATNSAGYLGFWSQGFNDYVWMSDDSLEFSSSDEDREEAVVQHPATQAAQMTVC